jgi:hypothetical protein
MNLTFKTAYTLIAIAVFAVVAASQTGVKPSALTGDVVSVNDSKIVLKTKDGDLEVGLVSSTEFKRVPPENPSLKAAVAAALSDIGVGDKLLVTGILSEDKRSLPARAVYLMTKSDIARKQQKDVERWGTRGISGRVASVNTAANQVTIEVRGLMNTTNIVVSAKPDAEFKRYAPNSVRYDEALESSIAEIKPGDMFRAVGDRGADGTSFTAEEIVTGAFQTIAGEVKSVDTTKNEVIIADSRTKKDVIVSLGSFSVLKKFPEEMAQRMTMGGGSGGPGGGIRPAGGQPGAQPAGERPAGGQPGAGQPGGGQGGPMRMGGARGGIDDIFERLPVISLADLKPGDVVAVSSSKNGSADKVTAIKVLAGVGPFLTAAQAQAAAQGGRGRSGQAGFSIPGLDGFDFGN